MADRTTKNKNDSKLHLPPQEIMELLHTRADSKERVGWCTAFRAECCTEVCRECHNTFGDKRNHQQP